MTVDLVFDVVSDDSDMLSTAQHFDSLCRFVLEQSGMRGHWEVTLALVDDNHLRALHFQFMGLDRVTDVMTFPRGDPGNQGGDIVVSVDRAAEQGPEHGLTSADEIRFLFVHGLLHLAGWDDHDVEDRAAMLARQTELVATFERSQSPG